MNHTAATIESSLGHMPVGDRWTFDKTVTDVFADMLKRSIPQYDVMRKAVYDMGVEYVRPGTYVVDLGCSRGDALAPFVDRFQDRNNYLGVEISKPMLEVSSERFREQIAQGYLCIEDKDLRQWYPKVKASLTLCILTLQFIPLNYRQRIIKNIYNSTAKNGAVILVEKILGATAELDEVMVQHYHQHKLDNGYSQKEIDGKRLSLEGVLVPVSARWNEEMLKSAGFTEMDCFWRWMNFAGWIAIKG